LRVRTRTIATCDWFIVLPAARQVTGEIFIPAVIDAVENYCTLAKLLMKLRKEFGEYQVIVNTGAIGY